LAESELILRLAVALAIGLVVGIERGWRERDEPAGQRAAGVRTFALFGLLGGVAAALGLSFSSPLPFAAALLGAGGAFTWFKAREAATEHSFSVTSVVAALAVMALGALAVAGDMEAAAAGGVATAGLLASRELLHGMLAKLRWEELRSALLLLAMTVVVLPLLPDRPLDPWGSANPRDIWLLTVLTAAVSFLGYIAVRIAGPRRGVLIGGLAGALVSSTAVTLAFARRAAAGERAVLLAAGAMLAGLISVTRVMAIMAIVAPPLLPLLLGPAIAGAAVFGLVSILLLRRPDTQAENTTGPWLGNPFELPALLAFCLGFSLVALLGGWLISRFGSGALLGTSAISGMFDVDVAALSAAKAPVPRADAAAAVLLALAVNALARAVVGAAAGPLRFSLPLFLTTLGAIGAGFLVFWRF
jgi:uncharacterized membrane protein (DUF4010 family)